MTRPGALESKKTLWGRLWETTNERVFEKMRIHLPDEPEFRVIAQPLEGNGIPQRKHP
jgi:hypothetical protein